MKNIFAMVTVKGSETYTDYAMKSFFKHTPLSDDDEFFLIDNDKSYESKNLPKSIKDRIKILKNKTPKGFAANANQALKRAKKSKADLYFLNNDLVFTKDWFSPLSELPETTLASPLCNQQVQPRIADFTFERVVDLRDYELAPGRLDIASRAFLERPLQLSKTISLPFFCIKIPYLISSSIGELDEDFGIGGGEDNDYCMRALEAGFELTFVSRFILHFNGRSTWGLTSKEESDKRCAHFREVFETKWGELLRRLVIDFDQRVFDEHPGAKATFQAGNFGGVVLLLKRGEG